MACLLVVVYDIIPSWSHPKTSLKLTVGSSLAKQGPPASPLFRVISGFSRSQRREWIKILIAQRLQTHILYEYRLISLKPRLTAKSIKMSGKTSYRNLIKSVSNPQLLHSILYGQPAPIFLLLLIPTLMNGQWKFCLEWRKKNSQSSLEKKNSLANPPTWRIYFQSWTLERFYNRCPD